MQRFEIFCRTLCQPPYPDTRGNPPLPARAQEATTSQLLMQLDAPISERDSAREARLTRVGGVHAGQRAAHCPWRAVRAHSARCRVYAH